MPDHKLAEYLDKTTVQQYKSDIGFRTLVESVNDNMYIIPKYQRKYRWSKEQVICLVESLLKGFPIPPIYTCRNDRNQLEILDGQQRVMSLFFYYIGAFLNKRKDSSINFSDLEVGDLTFENALRARYELEELHVSLGGRGEEKINVDYAALPVEVRRKVDYTAITVIEIKIGQEKKRSEILQTVFANLNKNGALLSRQEQRNGIYICEFYDMLQEFNRRNKKWRKLWGREDAKDQDLQILLRFCALKKYVNYSKMYKKAGADFTIKGYYGSYAEMLDVFSEEAVSFQHDEIDEYKKSLERFVELFEISAVMSARAALMEGFYIIFEKLGIQKKITKALLDQVQETKKYKENSRQRTVNIKKMKARWNVVYAVWKEFPE